MATHRGIELACRAVVELLRDNYDPSAFNRDLEFKVLATGGFESGLNAGVSVFLYRIMINDAHRTPAAVVLTMGSHDTANCPSTFT